MLNQAAVEKELAYLDDPALPVPPSLPLTALWLAETWQRVIAAEELRVVATTIDDPENHGAVPSSTRVWAQSVANVAVADLPDRASALLSSCPVPDETLAAEAGTPLMMRTLAKAAATTAAAMSSIRQMPVVVHPAISTVRTVTLAGYRLTNAVRGVARWLILIGFAALVLGVAAAIQPSTELGISGVLLTAIGAYLVVFGTWQTRPRVLAAVAAATVTLAVASLTLPSVRHFLFGRSAKDGGFVGRHVFWVGESPWRPLVLLGGVALVIAFLGLVRAPASLRAELKPSGLLQQVSRHLRVVLAVVLAVLVVLALLGLTIHEFSST